MYYKYNNYNICIYTVYTKSHQYNTVFNYIYFIIEKWEPPQQWRNDYDFKGQIPDNFVEVSGYM